MKTFFIFIFYLISYTSFSQSTIDDTLKVVVQTKFGELTFKKFCQLNKFEFQQTKDPIFDKDVELEAQEKQIEIDTLEVKFSINKFGEIVSFDIIKQSRLSKLNTFILDLFNDSITKLRDQNSFFNCDSKASEHIMPLIYYRQKPKQRRTTKHCRNLGGQLYSQQHRATNH